MSIQSKSNWLQNWKLYVVTESVLDANIINTLSEAIEGGASVIQLRDKSCQDDDLIQITQKLKAIARQKSVSIIINDRVLVAKKAGADGVHLGQEDGSLADARLILGEELLIGRSTHSPEQALDAQNEGFDYIGVGPVFSTPTKPTYAPVGLELVRFAAHAIKIPFVAIGGVNESNIRQVSKAGAKTVAVVRAIMQSQNPKETAQKLIKEMNT